MSEPTLALRALRGATTVQANTPAAITGAVRELMETLVSRNGLGGGQVLTAIFSVTADLDALFPASVARQLPGWEAVALLDCQQMAVVGDLPRCIRVLLQAWLPQSQELCHTYLREAQRLRPDRSGHN
ncbi:MAG: Chorismate mutase [Cyanobacteriota bacterium]|jgi:chorismate mutase